MDVIMQIETPKCNNVAQQQPQPSQQRASPDSVDGQPATSSASPQIVKMVPFGDSMAAAITATSSAVSHFLKVKTAPVAGSEQLNAIAELQQHTENVVVPQKVYNIIPTSQKLKSPYNNGQQQQRMQTVTAIQTNARVVPVGSVTSATTSTGQKVQILSNVVVAKQNLVLNKIQQPRQQLLTTVAVTQTKQNNNNNNNTNNNNIKVGAVVKAAVQPQQPANNVIASPKAAQQTAVNNLVITTPILANSLSTKTLKTVNVVNRSGVGSAVASTVLPVQQKTIKTLPPQQKACTGIKTLPPQVNHQYNKLPQNLKQSPMKMIPAQPVGQRVGLKTLPPQRPNNSNANTGTPAARTKPNYIGKHAIQAQKLQTAKVTQLKNNRAHAQHHHQAQQQHYHQVQQRNMSPAKQAKQSPTETGRSHFNQSLTAQILQNMAANTSLASGVFVGTKSNNYTAQNIVPDDTSLSEDIGEEVKPNFSSDLSFLHQVILLDHNYGAPPPAGSPGVARPPMGSQSAASVAVNANASVNGTVASASNATSYYGSPGSGKKRGRTSSGSSGSTLPHSAPQGGAAAAPDDDAGSTISSDGGRGEDGDEGEETETAPEGEGDEDGITKCICDFDHDDGYMICCDVCSSWQHVDCMGIDRNHIPDKYSCVRCEPRRIDCMRARTLQQHKREEFIRSGLVVPNPDNAGGAVGVASSGNVSDSSSDSSTADSTVNEHPRHHAGRQSSAPLNNNLAGGKKRGAPVSLTSRRKSEPAVQNRRNSMAQKRQQRRESARETSAAGKRNVVVKKREKKQTLKRKVKSRPSAADNDSQDAWPTASAAGSNNAATTPYLSSFGASSLVQLRQWIENYEEAVTNHYSPELRARIQNLRANGTHAAATSNERQAPPNAQADVAVQKCKVVTQPLTGFKSVIANQTLTPNTPVIELRGKYMLSTQHRLSSGGSGGNSGGNTGNALLTRQHTQRPGPFLFFYRLPKDGTEVCVDTRTYGNDARFIRRSCRPNAELRHCIEKGAVHLYVITMISVEKSAELTIKHESHDLAAAAAAASSSVAVNNIAAMIPCACGNPQQCALYNNHRKNGGNPVNETITAPTPPESTTPPSRKRRGRRTSSPGRSETPPPLASPPITETPSASSTSHSSQSPAEQPAPPPPPPALSTRRASLQQVAARATPSAVPATAATIGNSLKEHERSESKSPEKAVAVDDKNKKLTREERKLEAIVKAIERLEKAEQRKQEVQARQAQRRDSDATPTSTTTHNAPKQQNQPQQQQDNGGDVPTEREPVRTKRRKRKGRARTTSTSHQNVTRRRTRQNSADSYVTSGDESVLLSPPDQSVGSRSESSPPKQQPQSQNSELPEKTMEIGNEMTSPGQVNTAAGLLLALANGNGSQNESNCSKTPEADGNSSGSNSSLQSSPGTPLSSACLLVAAAVEPLEPGFKFPKTKKAIMNEWLNKPSESISSLSPVMSSLHHTSVLDPPTDLIGQHQQHVTEPDYYSSPPAPLPLSLTNVASNNKGLAQLAHAAASLCDSPPQSGGNCSKMGTSGQGQGNAKKRWLRQAISEECDSPSTGDSPPSCAEMVAPPKKRRLARESISSEQSFTPPTTPTMLAVPSYSMMEDEYQMNDEEFYTNEDRMMVNNSSPSPPVQPRPKMLTPTEEPADEDGEDLEEMESEPIAEMRMEFGTMRTSTDLLDAVKKYSPDPLTTGNLLDPRLGRDRPIFRDSAQLLGTVEKTIRFYEENLTGPLPTQSIPSSPPPLPPPPPPLPPPPPPPVEIVLEDPRQAAREERNLMMLMMQEKKADLITPAKRKLSISEYRQRKQLTTSTVDNSGDSNTTPERMNSPETPPFRSRADSTSSVTSSLSSDDETALVATLPPTPPSALSDTKAIIEPQVAVAFNSAPTTVERQRENVERIKKALGLTSDDDSKKTDFPNQETTLSSKSSLNLSPPSSKPISSNSDLSPTLSNAIQFTGCSNSNDDDADNDNGNEENDDESDDVENVCQESATKVKEAELKSVEFDGKDNQNEDIYSKLAEVESTNFIPPFNNPVYPNSTQFPTFTSVIDSSPYEGRNPSPPPLLTAVYQPAAPTPPVLAPSADSTNYK